MPIPAAYQPWVEFALAIAGSRRPGESVNSTCWLYQLLKELAVDAAEVERFPRRAKRVG